MIKVFRFAILCLLPSLTLAGTPIDDTINCPIGGPKIQTVGTLSCSTSGRFDMTLRQVSSCDFVTRLPVCQREGFPVYRAFDGVSVDTLLQITQTGPYKATRQASRFLRAHVVEQALQGMDQGTLDQQGSFYTLLSGYQIDPAKTYGDEGYYIAFQKAAGAFMPTATETDKAVIFLSAAMARLQLGDVEKARVNLQQGRKYVEEGQGVLVAYADQLQTCLAAPKADTCQPTAMFFPAK
ncbi:MAG: hypothetical protein ACPG5U_10285 [Planktomarina sp.]